MLQLDEREDDQTATTVVTTLADSDSEEEDDDNPEEAFEKEKKYREPPAEPMYNGQGTSNTRVRVPGACTHAAVKAHE